MQNAQTIFFDMFGSSINPGFNNIGAGTHYIRVKLLFVLLVQAILIVAMRQGVAYSGQVNKLSAATNTSITQPIT